MSGRIQQIKDAVVSGRHKEIEGIVRQAIDENMDLAPLSTTALSEPWT